VCAIFVTPGGFLRLLIQILQKNWQALIQPERNLFGYSAFFSVLLLILLPGSALAQYSLNARITETEGQVEVLRTGETRWQPVGDGEFLLHNDRVRTGLGASVRIALDGQSAVQMQGRSQFLYNNSLSADGKKGERIFSSLKGHFRFLFVHSDSGQVANRIYGGGMRLSADSAEFSLHLVPSEKLFSLMVRGGSILLSGSLFSDLLLPAGRGYFSWQKDNPSEGTIFGLDTISVHPTGLMARTDAELREMLGVDQPDSAKVRVPEGQSAALTMAMGEGGGRQKLLVCEPSGMKNLDWRGENFSTVWQPARFLQDQISAGLHSAHIGVTHHSEYPGMGVLQAELQDELPPLVLSVEIKQMRLETKQERVELHLSLQMTLFSSSTGFALREKTWEQRWAMPDIKELNWQKWLPLDLSNQRINSGVWGQVAEAVRYEANELSSPFTED